MSSDGYQYNLVKENGCLVVVKTLRWVGLSVRETPKEYGFKNGSTVGEGPNIIEIASKRLR